jgi:hypothetical protein
MNAYEQILDIMRQQGGKDNTAPIQLGIMESSTVCSIGKLKLSGEDLLVAEHLKTGYHKAINNEIPSQKDDSTFVKPLTKGDQVALYRINDELYIILGRLVSL